MWRAIGAQHPVPSIPDGSASFASLAPPGANKRGEPVAPVVCRPVFGPGEGGHSVPCVRHRTAPGAGHRTSRCGGGARRLKRLHQTLPCAATALRLAATTLEFTLPDRFFPGQESPHATRYCCLPGGGSVERHSDVISPEHILGGHAPIQPPLFPACFQLCVPTLIPACS